MANRRRLRDAHGVGRLVLRRSPIRRGDLRFDSFTNGCFKGWLEFGGTSVASPALAGVYALAGNAATLGPEAAQVIWKNRGTGLWHVTSGNNLAPGEGCGGAPYICYAGTGEDGVYSGPAGWGSPDGIADF